MLMKIPKLMHFSKPSDAAAGKHRYLPDELGKYDSITRKTV